MALSVTRKKNESIVLILEDGREILITMGDSQGGQTRISIDAPQDVEIWREELLTDH